MAPPPNLVKSLKNNEIKVPFNVPKRRKRSDIKETIVEENEDELTPTLSKKQPINRREMKEALKLQENEKESEIDTSAQCSTEIVSSSKEVESKDDLIFKRNKYKSKNKQNYKAKQNKRKLNYNQLKSGL